MFNWLFKRSSKNSPASNLRVNSTAAEQDLVFLESALNQVTVAPIEKDLNLQEKLDDAKKQIVNLIGSIKHLESQRGSVDSSPVAVTPDVGADDSLLVQELEEVKAENQEFLAEVFALQEELERQLIAKNELIQSGGVLEGRFERLLKRYSSYVDYQKISIVSFDAVAPTPEIVWQVDECFYAGTLFDRITFKTVLVNGKVGILIKSMLLAGDKKAINFKDIATLFPGSLKSDAKQQKLLISINAKHWHAFAAAVALVELSIKTNWRELAVGNDFDRPFWSSLLNEVARDFSSAPNVLRFEQALFKQEQVNSDYEHLWFELVNLSFGEIRLPKFEFRISAASIEGVNLSSFPKLEIPLIDGTLRPFLSWFPESFDDYGEKYELRFDLNKNSYDFNAFAKLSPLDRQFVHGLLNSVPNILVKVKRESYKPKHAFEAWNELFKSTAALLNDSINSAVRLKGNIS